MYYACVISTNIEINDPEKELEAAFKVINPVLEKFITVLFIFPLLDLRLVRLK